MKKQKLTRFQDSEFYFDDCAIFQAMKQAEDEDKALGLNELKTVFRKANKRGQKA